MKKNLWLLLVCLFIEGQKADAFFFSSEIEIPATKLPPLPSVHMDSASYSFNLDKSQDRCSNPGCRLWHQYIRGRFLTPLDPAKACDVYSEISDEKTFPLYPFVLIHQSEVCSGDSKKEAKILENINEYLRKTKPKRWLEQNLLQGATNAASTIGSQEFFDLTLSTSRSLRNKKAKVAILLKGIEAAKVAKSPKLVELQTELYAVAPRYVPLPSSWIDVANDAFVNHDYELAVKAYEKALGRQKLTYQARHFALENLKTSYKALQLRGDALQIAEKLWALDSASLLKHPGSEAAKRALTSGLGLARFIWTDHRDKEALTVISKIEKRLKNKVLLSDLYFLRGRIFEEQKKIKPALFWLGRAADKSTDPVQRNAMAWNVAWLNFKIKKFGKTKAILEEMIKIEGDAAKKAQESFWLAKADEQLGFHEEARNLFGQLISDDPFGYYTLLSYRELHKDIPPPPSLYHEGFFSKIPKRIPSTVNINWNPFDWLISVGELEFAREFLDEEAPLPDGVPDGWEEFFARYADASYYSPIFIRIPKLSSSEKTRLFSYHGDLIFPHKWSDFVDQGSHRSGLWPEYIFSIIRQESSFDPLAISGANAYGLMQILPSVAQGLRGKKKKVGTEELTKELLDPQDNVLLGSQHLRRYWDQFDGQFILTTAAYNASVDTVRTWLKTRFRNDPLVFIEDIPYEETRTYVKLVLRNFISYQRMAAGSQNLTFPEWCLDGIQVSKE